MGYVMGTFRNKYKTCMIWAMLERKCKSLSLPGRRRSDWERNIFSISKRSIESFTYDLHLNYTSLFN